MQCVWVEDSQVLHDVSSASLMLLLHYRAHAHCKSYGSPVLWFLDCSHIVPAQRGTDTSECSYYMHRHLAERPVDAFHESHSKCAIGARWRQMGQEVNVTVAEGGSRPHAIVKAACKQIIWA